MHDVKTTIKLLSLIIDTTGPDTNGRFYVFFVILSQRASSGPKHGCTTNTNTILTHDFLEIFQDLTKVSSHILDSNCSELPKLLTTLLRLLQQSLNLNISVISPFT